VADRSDSERTPQQLAVEAETRQYCELFQITGTEEIERAAMSVAYRQWREATQPLHLMRTALATAALNLVPVQYILHEDGRLERQEVQFPKETEALLAEINEMILAEARRYGLRIEPPEGDA
jgi:hypothetical protein